MAKNINSAYRVKDILDTVRNNADKTPAHEVWSALFGLTETNPQKKSFAISRCLADLHDEVEFVRSEMLKTGYTANLYEPTLNKCNSIFAVQLIPAQWAQPRQQITPEVSTILGFCSEILPNEEDLIDPTNLEELSTMANELRELLSKSTLPPYTINVLEKHLAKIEEALSTYKIVGAKSLETVVQFAYGEIIANKEVFEDAKGSEELGKLSVIWQKTKTTLDGVTSANKRISGVQGMAEKGQNLLELIGSII